MTLEWLGYIELLDIFTFRENASLSIPKSVRERAFSMQIDVEIVSTVGNDYLNSKSRPAYGFYGYAVLVFRNMAEIQIPLDQPRQRIYYERIESAYVNWYSLYVARVLREWRKQLNITLGLLTGALGIEEPDFPDNPCLQWCGFEEVPLREIYIKTREGIQFKVWFSHRRAIIRADGEDCTYDGTSTQVDDVLVDGTGRDDGLPANGTQPQIAEDPENPFEFLPPVSTASELGEFGNAKGAGLDFPNPDNAPTTPASQSCAVTIRTFTTAPENPVGVLASTYIEPALIIPFGDFLVIERYASSASFSGFYDAVKLNVRGDYYLGGQDFTPTRTPWSQRTTTIEAVCSNITP
jgi:hypothetical protein